MSHRWMKFWPQDWEGDVALRVVSLSAQGLWMRLLCAMHRSEPYGHLTMNGQAMTTRQIAALASVTERDAVKLLAELEDAGVLSRTGGGIIYSRRMVRDKAASDLGRKNGKTGGNPALKGVDSEPDKGGSNDGGLTPPLILQETEAEAEKTETTSLPVEASPSPAVMPPPDARATLWTEGLARLSRLTGKPDRSARTLLGQLCRTARDDCALVSSLLHEAEAGRIGDPIPWLQAAIQTRTGERQPERKQTALGEWAALMEQPRNHYDLDGEAEEIRH